MVVCGGFGTERARGAGCHDPSPNNCPGQPAAAPCISTSPCGTGVPPVSYPASLSMCEPCPRGLATRSARFCMGAPPPCNPPQSPQVWPRRARPNRRAPFPVCSKGVRGDTGPLPHPPAPPPARTTVPTRTGDAWRCRDKGRGCHDSARRCHGNACRCHDSARRCRDNARRGHGNARRCHDKERRCHGKGRRCHDKGRRCHDGWRRRGLGRPRLDDPARRGRPLRAWDHRQRSTTRIPARRAPQSGRLPRLPGRGLSRPRPHPSPPAARAVRGGGLATEASFLSFLGWHGQRFVARVPPRASPKGLAHATPGLAPATRRPWTSALKNGENGLALALGAR